jgi:dTDP-glucose 4,6-dehydratase/UDP-glucuronate decarboxylase
MAIGVTGSGSPGSTRSRGDTLEGSRAVIAADLALLSGQLEQEFSTLAGQHLVIAGGAGFLGHYLVQAPLDWNTRHPRRPIRVTVLDNLVRGMPTWLEELAGNPHLVVRRHDVTEPLPADLGDPDYLVHAASIASPTFYRRHPIETMDANVRGLRNLLDECLRRRRSRRPVRGLLFYSSSEIYGDPTPENIPTAETYNGNVSCTGPRACYDESKRFGEALCANFARHHEVPVKVARPFNNYGPGLKITDRRVIADFARDILHGRNITMLSDGSATRTFCYVADAVAGYFKILVRGTPGEAYNIGVEAPEISMGELAERMTALGRELLGYPGRVVRQPSSDRDYLVDNPHRRCPAIAKARRELGYAPQIPLDQGLRRALLWYMAHDEAIDS